MRPASVAPGNEAPARETTPDVAAIFVANHRALLAFLQRRVGSRAIAEELLQDAFVRSVGRVRAESEESVIAWFYTTLRNAAADHHRRKSVSNAALDAFGAESPAFAAPDVELSEMICRCVGELAETLKPEYAAAIRRIDVDGIAVKDFAAEVAITPGNAAVRIHRAREALRKQVTRACGTCAEHGCLDCECGAPASGT